MICPQCKAEYRQGFTRCADCDVDWVAGPNESERSAASARPSGNLVPLWEGEDLALHTTLLEHLDSAEVRYFDQPMGVFPGARRGDHFPVQPMTRFGYQVAVLSSDLEAAKGILENLLEDDRGNVELPESENAEAEGANQITAEVEKATCEVWMGKAESGMNFLHDALRENNIVTRTENTEAETILYVRPSDEGRAREIVRQIVDGAPPE